MDTQWSFCKEAKWYPHSDMHLYKHLARSKQTWRMCGWTGGRTLGYVVLKHNITLLTGDWLAISCVGIPAHIPLERRDFLKMRWQVFQQPLFPEVMNWWLSAECWIFIAISLNITAHKCIPKLIRSEIHRYSSMRSISASIVGHALPDALWQMVACSRMFGYKEAFKFLTPSIRCLSNGLCWSHFCIKHNYWESWKQITMSPPARSQTEEQGDCVGAESLQLATADQHREIASLASQPLSWLCVLSSSPLSKTVSWINEAGMIII